MSQAEFTGMLVGSIAMLLAVAIPIINSMLKLNTTLNRLASLIELLKKDYSSLDEKLDKVEAILDRHDSKLREIELGCVAQHPAMDRR